MRAREKLSQRSSLLALRACPMWPGLEFSFRPIFAFDMQRSVGRTTLDILVGRKRLSVKITIIL